MCENQLSTYLLVLSLFIFASARATAQQTKTYDQIAHAISYGTPPKPAKDKSPEAKPLKTKPAIPKHGVKNFDIYRDRNPYPVDPRKPCHVCIQRKDTHPAFADRFSRITGFQGRPHQDIEPGGCLCGKKKQSFKKPNINVYWPSMFAGVKEEYFPCKAAKDAATHGRFRLVNMFDNLGGFELSRYQRRDNGYCGPGRDRFGCLGESKTIESGVFGVGFREPGQPADRGGVKYP